MYCLAVGTSFFMHALLLSILTPLFLPFSFVSLSHYILAVPIRECLGKHSYMNSTFPIAIMNCMYTCFLSGGEMILALAEASPVKT